MFVCNPRGRSTAPRFFRRRVATVALLLSTAFSVSSCGGSQSFVATPFQPSQPAYADFNLARVWNVALEDAIIASGPRPTVVSRQLYLMSAASYDALAVYDDVATPSVLDPALRRPSAERTNFNKNAAVAYASYHALTALFADYATSTGAFSQLMMDQGYVITPEVLASTDLTTPAGIGRAAALAVLADRESDGSNAANGYADVTSPRYPTLYSPVNSDDPTALNSPGQPNFDPNSWVPLRVPLGTIFDPTNPLSPIVDNNDPDSFKTQTYLTPHWGNVRPFALSDGAAVRPPAPPQSGSLEPYTDSLGNTTTNDAAYNTQVDEVLNITAGLTDREKCVAEYWADGPRTSAPPGHWNEIALDLAAKYNYSVDDTVKMLFALNGGILDSSIAAWEAKRHYNFIRPISAIRNRYFGQMIPTWGGPGVDTVTRPGEEWIPFQIRTFVTPAFAEFVSGHSTFSASSAEILRRYTGSDEYYDGVTRGLYDFDDNGELDLIGEFNCIPGATLIDSTIPSTAITLRWNTLSEAADEAGFSRLYGGIHFQDGDRRGRAMGRQIGDAAFEKAVSLFNGGPQ